MSRPRIIVCLVGARGWQHACLTLAGYARIRERLERRCLVVDVRLVGDLA